MKTRFLIIIGFSFFVPLILGNSAIACQYEPSDNTIQENFDSYDFIFSGKILQVGEYKTYTPVTLEVVESWKGQPDEKILLFTCKGRNVGGLEFQEGQSYLIFAENLSSPYPVVTDFGPTKLLSEAKKDILFLDQKSHITRFYYDRPACDSGTAPEGNYVFFDCRWVEVPDHWKFEDGKWQEDPSVLKLGPEPDPVCPDVGVCTCPGKFNYYNSTDNRCYSSPYPTMSYQNACKQYAQLDFAGWVFDENTCDWVSTSDHYADDERLRLASEKIEPGGLGIDPVFDASTIIIGVSIGASVVVGLTYYWRKRR